MSLKMWPLWSICRVDLFFFLSFHSVHFKFTLLIYLDEREPVSLCFAFTVHIISRQWHRPGRVFVSYGCASVCNYTVAVMSGEMGWFDVKSGVNSHGGVRRQLIIWRVNVLAAAWRAAVVYTWTYSWRSSGLLVSLNEERRGARVKSLLTMQKMMHEGKNIHGAKRVQLPHQSEAVIQTRGVLAGLALWSWWDLFSVLVTRHLRSVKLSPSCCHSHSHGPGCFYDGAPFSSFKKRPYNVAE